MALARLPVTDVALGWRLRREDIDAVRSIVPRSVAVWRWVPVFVDSGTARPADGFVGVGPDGTAPRPFRDMADFRFLCLDRDEVIDAGLERAIDLGHEIDADGVLLDRIRWHSPSRSPAAELTCFCEWSQRAASAIGIDLANVGAAVRTAGDTLEGRRELVTALLGGGRDGLLGEFLAWRTHTVTRSVERLAIGLRDAGFDSALDVFTPALARSVGQDLTRLAPYGAWSKSMTYLDAIGPASLPFELRGYATWLEKAGETDADGFIADLFGFHGPGLGTSGAQLDALETEASRLLRSVGATRAIVGLDAVQIDGVCEVADADLDARVSALREAGVGLSPCWELLFIDRPRIDAIESAWAG